MFKIFKMQVENKLNAQKSLQHVHNQAHNITFPTAFRTGGLICSVARSLCKIVIAVGNNYRF